MARKWLRGNSFECSHQAAGYSFLFQLDAKELNSTLFVVLLGVFDIFLSRLSGQEDIIVGTPTAGRRHADLENIIGMFVNTIALRNFPCGGKTLAEFLEEVKYRSLEGFENQEYPFEDLVDALSLKRDISRNPVFDVMFNLLEQKDYPGGVDEMGERTDD